MNLSISRELWFVCLVTSVVSSANKFRNYFLRVVEVDYEKDWAQNLSLRDLTFDQFLNDLWTRIFIYTGIRFLWFGIRCSCGRWSDQGQHLWRQVQIVFFKRKVASTQSKTILRTANVSITVSLASLASMSYIFVCFLLHFCNCLWPSSFLSVYYLPIFNSIVAPFWLYCFSILAKCMLVVIFASRSEITLPVVTYTCQSCRFLVL